MANKIILNAKTRSVFGRKVKNLKKEGLIATNLSGSGIESVALVLSATEAKKLWEEMGETQVFYIKIEGEKADRPVLFGEIQIDVLNREMIHISLRQVNMKEKIEAEVEIELIGENKIAESVITQVRDSVRVEALPADLPEKFEIDISTLVKIGESVTFAQLKFDAKKVQLLIEAEEMDSPVVILEGIAGEVAESNSEAVEEVVVEATK